MPVETSPTPVPLSLRERRRQRTRRDLAYAAVRLFEQQGFANTSVDAIADAAAISKSTFFRLFPRKEDVVFYDLPERLDALRADFANPDHDPAWQVIRRAFVNNARAWEEGDADFAFARVRLFHAEPALEARYLEICLEWENSVAELVAADQQASPDPELRSRLVAATTVGAFRAAFQAWLAQPTTSLADHLEAAFNHLEAGLTATPAPTTRSVRPRDRRRRS